MKRTLTVLMLTILPLPALATDCGRWTAAMEEDEGGAVMTARICAPGKNAEHELLMRCGETGKLWLRFIQMDAGDPGPNYGTNIDLVLGEDKFTVPTRLEEMDGALAGETEIASPMLAAMEKGQSLTVKDAGRPVPGVTFTLAGSKAALSALIAECRKP